MNISKSTIASAVAGIFHAGKQDEIIRLVPSEYTFGTFAEHDYRVLSSHLWQVRSDIVRLQDYDTTALADKARAGARDHKDSSTGANEREEERLSLLRSACLTHAIIERHLESLAEQARKDTEKAGKKTADGGRMRFQLNSTSNREFKAYGEEFGEWLVGRKAEATPGTGWYLQLEAAEEQSFPLVDAQQATKACAALFESGDVHKTSEKAWTKVIDAFAQWGVTAHKLEAAQQAYALIAKPTDVEASTFASTTKELKRELKNSDYWTTRFLEPVAILCVLGAPECVTKSVWWRTEMAKVKAGEANAAAAEAEATAQEALAKVTQVTANMRLMDAMEMTDEAEQQLAEARQRMAQRKAERDAKYAAQTATMHANLETKVETDKPKDVAPTSITPPRVMNGRGRASASQLRN